MAIELLEIKGWAKLLKGKTTPKVSEELLQSLWISHNFTWLPLDYYSSDNSSVVVCPQRWATIPSLILDGVEIFYNDPKRRNDSSKKIREWFRMWPQSWNFSAAQMKEYWYNLDQHWFLRDATRERWERLLERWLKTVRDEIVYLFVSNQDTFTKFPHVFTASEKIKLGTNSANISLHIRNNGNDSMRFSPGHHTYYKVAPDQKKNIELDKNIWVNDKMKSKWISGEETIIVPNPWSCKIVIPGTGELQTDFDPQFWLLQLRSEKDQWFVCIEPVINRAEKWHQSAIITKPAEIMKVWFSVTLLSKDNYMK